MLNKAPWLNRVGFNADGYLPREPGKCSYTEFYNKRAEIMASGPQMTWKEAYHLTVAFYKQERDEAMKESKDFWVDNAVNTLKKPDESVEPDYTEFFGPESGHVSEAVKSDGGSSSYYELNVRVPASDCTTVTDQLIDVKLETGDVIRTLVDNDFDLGNVIKALRRLHLAANGKGKVGTDVEYDCKKIEYFMKNWYKNYQKDQL